jgi:hypothetical protein
LYNQVESRSMRRNGDRDRHRTENGRAH